MFASPALPPSHAHTPGMCTVTLPGGCMVWAFCILQTDPGHLFSYHTSFQIILPHNLPSGPQNPVPAWRPSTEGAPVELSPRDDRLWPEMHRTAGELGSKRILWASLSMAPIWSPPVLGAAEHSLSGPAPEGPCTPHSRSPTQHLFLLMGLPYKENDCYEIPVSAGFPSLL